MPGTLQALVWCRVVALLRKVPTANHHHPATVTSQQAAGVWLGSGVRDDVLAVPAAGAAAEVHPAAVHLEGRV